MCASLDSAVPIPGSSCRQPALEGEDINEASHDATIGACIEKVVHGK